MERNPTCRERGYNAIEMVLSTQRRLGRVLMLMALGALGFASAQTNQTGPIETSDCPESKRVEGEAKAGDFVVRIFRRETLYACIQVLRGNAVLYSRQGYKFTIGNGLEGDRSPSSPTISPGTDITGLGKPNVLVDEWTGGGHCCLIFHVLELGDSVREVASVNAQHSTDSYFADLDHDGVFEVLTRDWTFAYWHTSFADSPAPEIVLRFVGNGYKLALDLMRKPTPAMAELNKTASGIRADYGGSGYPSSRLWATMLELIYTGNPGAAWSFQSEAWPSTQESNKEFLRGFCGQLANSPYFEMLRPALADAPCSFDPKDGAPI
jgi:hypothetical protein